LQETSQYLFPVLQKPSAYKSGQNFVLLQTRYNKAYRCPLKHGQHRPTVEQPHCLLYGEPISPNLIPFSHSARPSFLPFPILISSVFPFSFPKLSYSWIYWSENSLIWPSGAEPQSKPNLLNFMHLTYKIVPHSPIYKQSIVYIHCIPQLFMDHVLLRVPLKFYWGICSTYSLLEFCEILSSLVNI